MKKATGSRPILRENVEAFVPSPRFLSESPRKPASAHTRPPGQNLSPNTFSSSPSIPKLRSPVPPPPANLFGGNPDAFNVDPGIPFLATAGPSDAGISDKGSIDDFGSPKQAGGGFVTGLKKALTIKGSRRQSSRYQQGGVDPPPLRDSGYATSDRLEDSLANQPPPLTRFSTPSPPSARPLVASDIPLNYRQATNDEDDAPVVALHDPPSLDSLQSAVTAHVGYGPDYIKMDRPTPPQSDVSFNTYMVRFQKIVHDLAALPWIAKERVTVDYYPAGTERLKRLSHRPLITWRSNDYNRADYHLDSDSIDSLTHEIAPHSVRAPSHPSRTDINLGSEFSDRTHSPFPYQPSNIVQTPDHRRVRSEGFERETTPPIPQQASNSFPHSSFQRRLEDPLSNPTQSFVPNWRNVPDTLPLFPPNSGQTPHTYPEESRRESRDDANLLLQTPSARKYRGPESLRSFSSNPGRIHSEDPRLGSRNNANATYSTPTRHRPASVRSTQRWQSTPRPDHLTSPIRRSETTFSIRPPNPGSGQPASGSPSRRSHKSHTTSRRPRGESTEEWQSFPQDRPGYVPFEFSEHHYGTQYGVGIHGLLPPVGDVYNASPAPSIKQPQPQYPRSTFVTPPSPRELIS